MAIIINSDHSDISSNDVLTECPNRLVLRWNAQGHLHFISRYSTDFFSQLNGKLAGQEIINAIGMETGQFDAVITEIEANPKHHIEIENRYIHESGQNVWISWSHKGIYDHTGQLREILSCGIEVSERRQAQDALLLLAESVVTPEGRMEFVQESVKNLAKLYDASVALMGVFSDDSESSIQTLAAWVNGSFVENYIYELEHVPCNDVVRGTANFIPNNLAKHYAQCTVICNMGLESYYGFRLVDSHGQVMGVVAVLDSKPMTLNHWSRPVLRIFANRIAAELDRKNAEDKIYQLAHYDTLTTLPNRALFQDRLKQEIAHADRNKKYLALLYIDLNRFKPVNDTLGHPVGDRVLYEIAQRLLNRVRSSDTVARMGGDEFTVLLSDIEDKQSSISIPSRIAQIMLDDLAKPIKFNNHEIIITAGIGIAIYSAGSEHADSLIHHADMAMYHAKKLGESAYLFYEQKMNVRNKERLQMEAELHHALEENQLQTFYQPVVALSNEQVVGVEALLRWQHPRHGLITPSRFIEIAEYSGLIIAIGEWVLRQSCLQAVSWKKELGIKVYVSVNLSLRQVRSNKLIRSLKDILQETEMDPGDLRLEITESTFIDNMDETIKVLEELRAMGIPLAIDDFGTGYSSLAHLKRLPFATLKIDKSFVQDVTNDEDDAAIVGAIIAMSHHLHLTTIAEGVETKEQLEFLKKKGCDMAQGFFYGKPLIASECSALLIK